MARAAKKETPLTTEEKLAKALVPEEEQPYPVPENWCWVKLKHVAKNISDGSHNPPPDSGKGIPLLSAQNIHDNMIDISGTKRWITEEDYKKENTRTNIEPGDVLLTIVATIGRSAIVGNELFALQRSVAVIKPTGVLPSYMMYYFDSPYNQSFMEENAKGTAQKGFYLKSLEQLFFPLPPLPEQQRIVTLIESLFDDLDAAKEKLQAVLDGFAKRRASLLHQAFTGELTREWREEHNINDEWEETPLEAVCASIFDGDHMPPPKAESGVPFLVIANVNTGHLSFENTRFVPQEYFDGISDSRKPKVGDVLYTLVGSYGIPVVVDDDRPFCFQRHMALIKPAHVNTYFLWYQLQSVRFYNKATDIATGTAQLTIPIKGLRKLTIFLPDENEQREIVRILDDVFGRESQSKAAVESALAEIDTMKKAILATAFRGKFGTNDCSDEGAKELLRRVL